MSRTNAAASVTRTNIENQCPEAMSRSNIQKQYPALIPEVMYCNNVQNKCSEPKFQNQCPAPMSRSNDLQQCSEPMSWINVLHQCPEPMPRININFRTNDYPKPLARAQTMVFHTLYTDQQCFASPWCQKQATPPPAQWRVSLAISEGITTHRARWIITMARLLGDSWQTQTNDAESLWTHQGMSSTIIILSEPLRAITLSNTYPNASWR